MKFKKPKFWDYNKPNILSYIFFPVSLLLTILKSLKNLMTKKKKYLRKKHYFSKNTTYKSVILVKNTKKNLEIF